MNRSKRRVPEINFVLTADIAFLLLIFFLIFTSMDTNKGLSSRLPIIPISKQDGGNSTDILKSRNMLDVYLNKKDQLIVDGNYTTIDQLRDIAKNFIDNPDNERRKPEKIEMDVPYFGPILVTSKHIISLRNDRGSSYQAYIFVQDELVGAYNDLRDKLSQKKWQKKYTNLKKDEQKAILLIYPQRISEVILKKGRE
jgi:biopolymer transport protein ExbD